MVAHHLAQPVYLQSAQTQLTPSLYNQIRAHLVVINETDATAGVNLGGDRFSGVMVESRLKEQPAQIAPFAQFGRQVIGNLLTVSAQTQ